MNFQYSAKSAQGELSSGLLVADSLAGARQALRSQGLFPLLVKPTAKKASLSISMPRFSLKSRSVPKQDLMLLTMQLVFMSRAGIDIAEALQSAASQCPNVILKDVLGQIHKSVTDGLSISAAFAKQTHIFGETYVATIAAGEAAGQMPESLQRMADLLKNQIRLRSSLQAALSYPIILASVSMLVVAGLIFFVMPKFATIIKDMGTPVPATTQLLLGLSQKLSEQWWLWGGLAAATVVFAMKFWNTPTASRCRDQLAVKLYIVRDVTCSLSTGRLFSLLGTMLQSGVPLLDALKLCEAAIKNGRYRQLIKDLQEDVLNGRGMGKALTAAEFVPGSASQMIVTAERTGKLGSVMQLVGEYYENEGERKLQELTRFLEPAITLGMGVVVAFVVLSVLLPMLDISTMAS